MDSSNSCFLLAAPLRPLALHPLPPTCKHTAPGPAWTPPRPSPSRALGGQTVSAGIPVCGSFEKCGPCWAPTAGNSDMTSPQALLGGCTSRAPPGFTQAERTARLSPGQAGVGRAGHGGLRNPAALATWALQPEAALVFQVSYRHRGNAGFSWTRRPRVQCLRCGAHPPGSRVGQTRWRMRGSCEESFRPSQGARGQGQRHPRRTLSTSSLSFICFYV